MIHVDVLFVTSGIVTIIGVSYAIGRAVERLNWRRRYELLALVTAVWAAVGVAHLLPLGHWTLLGYGVAVGIASASVYAGWRISRGQRRYGRLHKPTEPDPLGDPNHWGYH